MVKLKASRERDPFIPTSRSAAFLLHDVQREGLIRWFVYPNLPPFPTLPTLAYLYTQPLYFLRMKFLSDNFTQILNAKERQYFGYSGNNIHKGNFSSEHHSILLKKCQETLQVSFKHERFRFINIFQKQSLAVMRISSTWMLETVF